MTEQQTTQDNHSETVEEATMTEKLTACQAELMVWQEKFLRSNADFQNFKRRSEKEQALWMQSAQADLLKGLLPIVDDVDRALAEYNKQEQAPENTAWIAGFQMIGLSLHKFLKKSGVEEVDATVFDPSKHEAIALVPAADKKQGDIVEVLQKGFIFKGELLRPARVAVAQ